MNTLSLLTTGATVMALSGCVAYPVYQPAPIARLTPAQAATLNSQPVDPTYRANVASQNAEVQRDDQADIDAQRQAAAAQPYTYVYPAPYYGYGYAPYYGPYYGGFYPWVPGLSLSFGYSRGWGGGYRGGWHGHR